MAVMIGHLLELSSGGPVWKIQRLKLTQAGYVTSMYLLVIPTNRAWTSTKQA